MPKPAAFPEAAPKTIGDFFTLRRGKTYKSRLLGDPGPILLGLASIHRNGGFRADSLRTYGGECPENLLVQPGELYVSLKDVTQAADLLGAVAMVPSHQDAGRLTQDTVKLEPTCSTTPLDYIYWLLRTPECRDYCRAHATGTTNLGLSRADFLAFPVPPATPERLRLVDVLTTLDDKIELNRRMNATLEAMARALFRSWFVDFDPVQAKMEGRDTGLPKDIADLFPDRLVDSELREIPADWDVAEIGTEVDAVGGSTPSTKEPAYWNGGRHCWATPKDLSKLSSPALLGTDRKVTDAGLRKIGSGLLPRGTVLLSSRAPIGYLAITEVPTAVNQGFIAMICRKRLPALYVLSWCHENLEHIKDISGGSTFAEISKKTFRPLPIVVPLKRVLEVYDGASRSLHDRVVSNTRESALLASLREALLPKLVSGELRVDGLELATGSVDNPAPVGTHEA